MTVVHISVKTSEDSNETVAQAKVNLELSEVSRADDLEISDLRIIFFHGRNALAYDYETNEEAIKSLSNPEMESLYIYATAMVA